MIPGRMQLLSVTRSGGCGGKRPQSAFPVDLPRAGTALRPHRRYRRHLHGRGFVTVHMYLRLKERVLRINEDLTGGGSWRNACLGGAGPISTLLVKRLGVDLPACGRSSNRGG